MISYANLSGHWNVQRMSTTHVAELTINYIILFLVINVYSYIYIYIWEIYGKVKSNITKKGDCLCLRIWTLLFFCHQIQNRIYIAICAMGTLDWPCDFPWPVHPLPGGSLLRHLCKINPSSRANTNSLVTMYKNIFLGEW